jgi:hypothetical protein
MTRQGRYESFQSFVPGKYPAICISENSIADAHAPAKNAATSHHNDSIECYLLTRQVARFVRERNTSLKSISYVCADGNAAGGM